MIAAYIARFDRAIWILALGWFVSAMGFSVSLPFISIYFHGEAGMSIAAVGLVFGLMAIVRSVFQAVGGELADHVPRTRLLLYSQLARAGTFVLMTAAVHFSWPIWVIVATLMLNASFGAVFQPTANALITDILPPEKRMDGFAICRAGMNLGWAVGPALGGLLAAYAFSLLFAISSVITLASCVIYGLFLNVSATGRTTEAFKFSHILTVASDRPMLTHCVLFFLLSLVIAQLIAPFSIYVVDILFISKPHLGLLYTFNGLLVATFQLPVTRLASRFKLTDQLILGALLYGIGYALVGWRHTALQLIPVIILVTFAEIIVSPPAATLTSRLAPPESMGRYMGIFGFFSASGWSFGPLYGGMIIQYLGQWPAICWAAIAAMAFIAAAGYKFMDVHPPPGHVD